MIATVDAKTAARQRVRAFLQARQSYAASLGHAGFASDEITRQVPNAHTGTAEVAFATEPLNVPNTMTFQQALPLLASDLAILAADD